MPPKSPHGFNEFPRLSWAMAASLGVAFSFMMYFTGVVPQWLDSTELTSNVKALGIGHPPGQPGFHMAYHFLNLIPLGSLALRISVFNIICILTCASLMFASLSQRGFALALAASILSLSSLSQVIAQELYALHACLFALTLVLVRRDHLNAAAFLLGYGCTIHPYLAVTQTGVWLISYALFSGRLERCSPRAWLAMGASFCLGLLPLIYLPIRAHQYPLWNMGTPTNLESFWWVISGKLYDKSFGQASLLGHEHLQYALMALFAGLGLIKALSLLGVWLGTWVVSRDQRLERLTLLAMVVISVLPIRLEVDYDNPDTHGYLLVPIFLAIQQSLGAIDHLLMRRWAWTFVAFLACLPVYSHIPTLLKQRQPSTDVFAYTLLTRLPDKAEVAMGGFQTYSQLLGYQILDGLRPDVTVHYRGDRSWRGDHVYFQTLGRPKYYELDLRQAGNALDLRIPSELRRRLEPQGWLFRLLPHDQTAAINATAVQAYWDTHFSLRNSEQDPFFHRQVCWAHYLHAKFYEAPVPTLSDWHRSQCDFE